MKPIFHEKLRKSKQESKLAKPPKKKHLNINKGPSTNLEASVQTDELLETGSVLARLPLPPPTRPPPAPCSSHQPRGPLPAAPTKTNQVGAQPAGWAPGGGADSGRGSPARLGPELARAGLSPASFYTSRLTEPGRGSHWRIVTGRVGGCPLPRKPLILCLPTSPAPAPAALAQADSGKDVKRGPGLLSTVDRDPGKHHLAFLCVSDTHSPGRDTSKRAVSADRSHCYSFGRAFGFKVTDRLVLPEATCGTWGLPS